MAFHADIIASPTLFVAKLSRETFIKKLLCESSTIFALYLLSPRSVLSLGGAFREQRREGYRSHG